MFRPMLMAGASRMAFAPETDEGFEDADAHDEAPDVDEDFDDADEGDEDGGAEDRLEDDNVGDDDGQEDGQAEVSRPASRGGNRIATLAAERAAEKARADALERELAQIRQGQTQQQQHQAAEEERQRLALMDPEERAEYRIRQSEQRTQQVLNEIRFQAADSADKTAFEGLCARNPSAAALKDEVEQALQTMRASGTTAPRETVLKYLLGEKALSKAPRASAAAARKSAANRERQQARAVNGRGDVPANGGRRGSEAEQRRRRLENMEI